MDAGNGLTITQWHQSLLFNVGSDGQLFDKGPDLCVTCQSGEEDQIVDLHLTVIVAEGTGGF